MIANYHKNNPLLTENSVTWLAVLPVGKAVYSKKTGVVGSKFRHAACTQGQT